MSRIRERVLRCQQEQCSSDWLLRADASYVFDCARSVAWRMPPAPLAEWVSVRRYRKQLLIVLRTLSSIWSRERTLSICATEQSWISATEAQSSKDPVQ